MTQLVYKRNGDKREYDPERIANAILLAWGGSDIEFNTDLFALVMSDIEQEIELVEEITVREIESLVEASLIENGLATLAEQYTTFRLKKAQMRAELTDVAAHLTQLSSPDTRHDNANQDSQVFHTQLAKMAEAVARPQGAASLPDRVRDAHAKGLIYVHDLSRAVIPQSNCFHGDTKFVTSEGVYAFRDFAPGSRVQVLTPAGVFVPATVQNFGPQSLRLIHFKRGKSNAVVLATKNHRWELANGLVTTNLNTGDMLADFAVPVIKCWDNMTLPEKQAWVDGFVFGNGSEVKYPNPRIRVRLCGNKRQYQHRLEEIGYHVQSRIKETNYEPVMYGPGRKQLPCDGAPPNIISVFIQGLLDADGSRSGSALARHKTTWFTSSPDAYNWMLRNSAVASYFITTIRDHKGQTTNFTSVDGRLFGKTIRFQGENLHGNQYGGKAGATSWRVSAIVENVLETDVWCVVTDSDDPFMLANGIPTRNCSIPNLAAMFADGFTMGAAPMRHPRNVLSAASQLSQAITAVSSSQYGGTTAYNVDLLLEPYAEMTYEKHLAEAKKWQIGDIEAYAEEKTIKHCYDASQSFLHNLNSTYSTNAQVPFVSVIFGSGLGRWAREIQKALLQVQLDGFGAGILPDSVAREYGVYREDFGGTDLYDADYVPARLAFSMAKIALVRKHPHLRQRLSKGTTAIFPKLIFLLKNGINRQPQDPNYDIKQLAIQCAAKRIYPDILCVDNATAIGLTDGCMGCRSLLSPYIDPETGLVVTDPSGRLNLGVVTTNLPRIALETTTKAAFFRLLGYVLDIVHQALRWREAWVRTAKPSQAPILYKYGAFGKRLGDTDDVGVLFDNHRATLSLGYIGLHEVAVRFYGENWHDNPDAKAFTVDVLRFLKERADHWNTVDRSGTNGCVGAKIAVYGTPAESLTHRFARIDRDKFGSVPGITDKGNGRCFYTNSFHVDSRLGEADGWTWARKFEFEREYLPYTTGGAIIYCEASSLTKNPAALEAIWDYAHDLGIVYFGVNSPIDQCFKCGFSGEFTASNDGFACPGCGNTGNPEAGDDPSSASVVRRVCFPAGELVLTKRGYLPIEYVTVGTQVLTHTGNYSRVGATFRRRVPQLVTLPTRFSCTPDHPVLAKTALDADPKWVPAADLRPGDLLAIPIDNSNVSVPRYLGLPTELTDFWWLLGLLLARGYWRRGRLTLELNPATIGVWSRVMRLTHIGVGRPNYLHPTRIHFDAVISTLVGCAKTEIARWLDLPSDLGFALVEGFYALGVGRSDPKIYRGIEHLLIKTNPEYFNNDEDTSLSWVALDDAPQEVAREVEVYGLAVHDDASYTVANVAVKNCGYLGEAARPFIAGRQHEIAGRNKHTDLVQDSDG